MSVASWIAILVFAVIILSSILALAIGFFRGLFKTSIKAVIKLLFIILWMFVTPVLAKNIVNIDLSRAGIPNFFVNGREIVVTNISETVSNIITALGFISPVNGLSIYSFLVSVTELVLCYGIFLVMMLISNLTVELISTLIYNGVFRWFYQIESFRDNIDRLNFEKGYRKNSKSLSRLAKGLLNSDGTIYNRKEKHPLLKIGGALIGFFSQLAFILVVCSPITAIFRIAEKNKENIFLFAKSLAPNQSEIINETDDFIETIANSPLSKIYTLPGGLSLDTLIMNRVATQNLYGYEINLDSLISSITDVAKPIMTNDSISYQEGLSYVTYNFSTLLSVSTIDAIISSILLPQNSSFYALIPPLIDIGIAMISANTSFTLDSLDFRNIDWSHDLEAINSIYDLVYSEAIDSIIENGDISPHNFYMNTSEYSDSKIDTLAVAARVVGSTSLIQKNAGNIINTLRTVLSAYGYDLFPDDESQYNEIDWSNEFYIIAKSFFRLLKIIDVDIQANMNFTVVQENLINSFRDKNKREVMKDILIGENGLFNLKLFNLLKKGDTVLALLDTFLTDNINGISKYTNNERFQSSVKQFNNKDVRDIKLEVSYLFSIINILSDETKPIHWDDSFSFITREEFDKETATEIYDLLQIARNSTIFSSLYPIVLESYLTNNFSSGDVNDFLFGLTPYHFNYDDEEFVNDISRVILVMPEIVNLYQKINGDYTKKEKIDALDPDSIKIFLNVLANSQFFNPTNKYIKSNEELKNINMEIILNTLFSSDIFKSLELELPTREKIASANWGTGESKITTLPSGKQVLIPQDEIANICLMIKCIKDNVDYFSLDLKDLRLADLDLVDNFEGIFDLSTAIINSDLFRESGVNALVSKLDRYFEKKNIIFSFNDLRNYAYDEKNKNKLLDDLYSLKILSPLFNKLDYTSLSFNTIPYLRSLDADEFNAFFTTLAKTNYCKDSLKDPLANFIYLSLKKFDIFDKYNLVDYSPEVFSPIPYAGSSWIKNESTKTFLIDDIEYEFNFTTNGSVRNICSLFDAIKSTFYISKLKEGDYSTLDFRSYLNSELELEKNSGYSIYSDMFIRRLFYIYSGSITNILKNNINEIPKEFFDFNVYINPDYICGNSALPAIEYGESLYDLNEMLLVMTYKLNDDELVFNRLVDLNKVFTLGESEIAQRLFNVMESIKDKKLLTHKKDNYSFSPMGNYFYNLFKNNLDVINYFVLGDNNNSSQSLLAIKEKIHFIDNESINSGSNSWAMEISKYKEILSKGNSISYDPNLYDLETYSGADLKIIYDNLNKSYLLHTYLVHRIEKFTSSYNFDQLLVGRDSQTVIPKIRFDKHLTNSDEDTKYYSHDYDIIFKLIDDELPRLDIFSQLINKTFNISFFNPAIIYLFSTLNLFEDNYHYVVASFIRNSSLDNYFSIPEKRYYLQEDLAIRIKEIFPRNDIFTSSNFLTEYEMLTSTLTKLEPLLNNNISSIQELKELVGNNYFSELMSLTYNTNYRSSLASEIVSGVLIKTFTYNSEIQNSLIPYSNYNYYSDEGVNYYYINSETGQEIDSLINN